MSEAFSKEKKMLDSILPRFDLHGSEHDAPEYGFGPVEPLLLENR